MKINDIPSLKQLLWLSDIHLDCTSDELKSRFLAKLRVLPYDCVVITGDISNGTKLAIHLAELAEACAPRPGLGVASAPRKVYFCAGNHDYYGSSFAKVAREIQSVCSRHENLNFLGNGEIIQIGRDTALVGHGGWPDGRAGWGKRTIIKSRDHHSIEDFHNLSKDAAFDRMTQLGYESARYFRRVLPYALSCFPRVLIATHPVPFPRAAIWNGKACGLTHLPHYCNVLAGAAILSIARKHPLRKLTLMCGHTHSASRIIIDNLEVRVAGAQRGRPATQGMIEFN